MTLKKQALTALACTLLAFPLTAAAQSAQTTYPNKPVRMLVPFAPGGGVDFVGRLMALKLTQRTGQQFVVENRAGANGITGLQALMAASPDGYTIAAASTGPLAVNPFVYNNLPYDTLRDFTIIARTNDFPLVLLVHPSLPVRNIKGLMDLARARPDQMSYGSSGAGNADHLAMELFRSMAKLRIVHVPYKGAGPSTIALLSGETQLMFSSLPSALPQVKAGRMRALGIGNAQRLESQPDFPTVAEGGLPGFEAYSWGGLIGPANMPRDIVQKLNRETIEVLRQKDTIEQLVANGTVPTPSTPEEFTAFIKVEMQKWGAVAKAAKVTSN
jgi:tripartite-type tricarboxylate transporter receptor subunit TctC